MAQDDEVRFLPRGAERTVLTPEPAAPVAVRKRPPAPQPEAIEGTAAPGRGVNVRAVADEVMKQLDRRWVAARERMGKI